MQLVSRDKQLTSLEIEGYKSIKSCKLELGALNILIGANGAGKTNFISFFSANRGNFSWQSSAYGFQTGRA